MFICNNCRNVFDEPNEIKECVGEFWGTPAYRTRLVCPSCRENDFAEAHDCPRCGEATGEDDFFCKPCQDVLLTLYKEVMERFTVEEQVFLLDVGADAITEVAK